MNKLSRSDHQMQEHFGNLTTEISILRHEMKQELDGVKKSLRDVEKSLEAAWDSINDIQEETKTHNDYKKTCQQSLDSHRQELDLLKVNLKKVDSQQAEIENLKTRLLEEQEKIIALENYSRRENLRFMNVSERNDENCMDVVYDIIENDMNINVEDIHFHAIHRVGKPRSADASKSFPRPIIARFLSGEDRDTVFRARKRMKDSSRAKDVSITQDYAKRDTAGKESIKSDVPSTCLIETFNLNFVFPLSRKRTAASRIRLSSSETPYGPNQRTFNVLLDLFVYFSLVPFCFWWQYLFSLFSHTN